MRTSRLLGVLLVPLLGLSLLPAAPATAVDPEKDRTVLPRSCATYAEEVPQDALICHLTKFRKGRPTVFLWGDSHAWMQVPGLLKAAKGQPVNVVASIFGSCPPMDPGLSYKDRYKYGRCGASADLAMRYVRKMNAGPQAFQVLLAANWEMYERALKLMAQGKEPGRGHAQYAFYQSEIFKHGGPRMIKHLAELRVDVDIVGQVARAPRKPKPCAKGMDPYQCAFPRRQGFRDEQATTQWLSRLMAPVARRGGMRYFNLTNHFCSPTTCRPKVDGNWTYHDNSHITASLSRQMSGYYVPTVADALRG